MTNDNLMDQTVCNLPFEVVTIYDNGSQNLQSNTKSNSPPSVNVKIRIRNKEDTERRGIISVPRLTAINWPKRVRLVNSAQTIMSFNLAMEQNSDEAQKKSNRKLFQMFKPGGCLSIHRDEDGYSYMPSSSNQLKRKSASGIEDDENGKIAGTFALKKNDFAPSYTNTLKTPKTFMGKCKPDPKLMLDYIPPDGGCLDPPFSEDKYTYKPAVEDAQLLKLPVTKTNSLQPDINIMDVKHKHTSQDHKQNIVLDSYPDTKIVENTAMLVTYPSNISSSNLKTKDSQNKKLALRLGEQVDLSRKLTNEFPEAFFIPTRKEKSKNEKSYSKNNYDKNEPEIREAYVNKDYILKSQTPSELLSDNLTITSHSFDEPLKNKQIIRELSTTTQLLIKSKDVLSNSISKDNVRTISTKASAKGLKEDENTFLQEQNPSNPNNIPVIQNMFSYIKDSNNALNTPISRSSLKVNTIQKTSKDIYYENAGPNNDLNFDDKQLSIYSLELSKDSSTKFFKDSIDETRKSLHSFEMREQNNILRQHRNFSNNDINKDSITYITQPMELRTEENNNINPLKDKRSGSLKNEYYKNISGQVISNEIIKGNANSKTVVPKSLKTIQGQGEDVSNNLETNVSEHMSESISEPTNLLLQELKFKDNNKTEESVEDQDQREDQKTKKPIEEFIDIQHSNASTILPNVTALQSVDNILSPRSSQSVLISPENNDVNQKDSLLDNESSKLTLLINKKINADKQNEPKESIAILENKLSSQLITGQTSPQKIEINTIDDSVGNHEISLELDKLDDPDTTLLPKMLQLHDTNTITLNNENIKKSIEIIESVLQSRHEFTDFDSLEYRKSLKYSTNKEEAKHSNTFINDSNITLINLKPDINIGKSDILSDDKFRKSSKELTINNIRSLQTLPNTIIYQEIEKGIDNFLENPEKSDSDIETSKEKSSQKFDNVQELKTVAPTPEIKKSITDNKKKLNSSSSVAINFGFRTFKNEKTGRSIETFDPSISLASYPQDKIVTIKTVLRKNNSEFKVDIDSETDLTMQINSRKLAPNILKSYTNENRAVKIRAHSSETLMNKDKLIQETLKSVYENLITIEKNIIKLKEEAESLYREQLLLKNILLSKEIKPYRIIPNVGTCSCLQREIGLE